jgi:hypothetical protein
MKTTTDTYTGKRFRWNETVRETRTGLLTPSRCTSRDSTWLHPGRVPVALLRELNPGTDVEAALEKNVAGRVKCE